MKELFVTFENPEGDEFEIRVIDVLQVLSGFWIDDENDYVVHQKEGKFFVMPHFIKTIESKTVYTKEEIDN